jgi:hypothetical protein
MLDQSRDRGICTVSATMQAPDDPAMCQQLVDQCNILRPAQDSDCGELTVEALETCSDDISVRDLRACIGELIDWFDSADCQSDRDAPPACTMTLDNACPGSDGDAFNQPPQPNLVGTACAAGDTSVEGCPATPNTMCGMAGGTVTRVCHLPGLQPSLQPPPQPPPQGIWSACCCAQGGTLFCPQ